VGPAWLAVADAASCFDPLSSLGLFKALRQALITSYACKDYLAQDVTSGEETHPALLKYQYLINAEFQHYLSQRNKYYQLEKRFPQSSFWQRRSGLSM